MKTAFVHDRIINIGGAEKVFFDIIEKTDFDEAKIFTAYSDKKFIKIKGKKLQVITALPTWILKILRWGEISQNKIIKLFFDYRNLMFFYPILMFILSLKIRFYKPQQIKISSFAIAKNLSFLEKRKDALQCIFTLYLHSPNQYVWSHYEEYLGKFNKLIKVIFRFSAWYIRKWDRSYHTFDEVEFNSFYTQSLAKEIYELEGKVTYPNVISLDLMNTPVSDDIHDYYIYIGRLVRFVKELDTIIELFNHTGENLIICGRGPDEIYLKSIAGSNIIFVDYVEGEEKIKLLKKAKGFINITKESFGIATAEALCLGVPVLGFNKGGSVELVDEKSGILINDKDIESLLQGFEKFENTVFDRETIKRNFLEKYTKNI